MVKGGTEGVVLELRGEFRRGGHLLLTLNIQSWRAIRFDSSSLASVRTLVRRELAERSPHRRCVPRHGDSQGQVSVLDQVREYFDQHFFRGGGHEEAESHDQIHILDESVYKSSAQDLDR